MFSLIPRKKRIKGGDLKPWRGFDEEFPLARFRSEFESLWNRFWSDRGLSLGEGDFAAAFHGGLEDKETEFVFHAELPGFEPSEIDVKLSGNLLTVKAEHKEEKDEKEVKSYHYGAFERHVMLPQGIDGEHIEARYHSGVLEVHLPKTEETKGKRIPVTTN